MDNLKQDTEIARQNQFRYSLETRPVARIFPGGGGQKGGALQANFFN